MAYIYKEYPRTLHKPDGSVCTVRDDAKKAEALAAGWNLLPGEPPAVVEPPPTVVTEDRPSWDEIRDADVPVRHQVDLPRRGRRKAAVN